MRSMSEKKTSKTQGSLNCISKDLESDRKHKNLTQMHYDLHDHQVPKYIICSYFVMNVVCAKPPW